MYIAHQYSNFKTIKSQCFFYFPRWKKWGKDLVIRDKLDSLSAQTLTCGSILMVGNRKKINDGSPVPLCHFINLSVKIIVFVKNYSSKSNTDITKPVITIIIVIKLNVKRRKQTKKSKWKYRVQDIPQHIQRHNLNNLCPVN